MKGESPFISQAIMYVSLSSREVKLNPPIHDVVITAFLVLESGVDVEQLLFKI